MGLTFVHIKTIRRSSMTQLVIIIIACLIGRPCLTWCWRNAVIRLHKHVIPDVARIGISDRKVVVPILLGFVHAATHETEIWNNENMIIILIVLNFFAFSASFLLWLFLWKSVLCKTIYLCIIRTFLVGIFTHGENLLFSLSYSGRISFMSPKESRMAKTGVFHNFRIVYRSRTSEQRPTLLLLIIIEDNELKSQRTLPILVLQNLQFHTSISCSVEHQHFSNAASAFLTCNIEDCNIQSCRSL